MTGPAQFKTRSRPAHKTADAAAKLIRISGEVISATDAAIRSGRTRATLLAMYRDGKRTWGELERGGKNADRGNQ